MRYTVQREYLWPTEHHMNLPGDQTEQLRRHLQRDGMCGDCTPWRDIPIERSLQAGDVPRVPLARKFSSGAYCRLHCDECGTHHNTPSFSIANKMATQGRQCLGREGGVQLCENVHIYWADIEYHINSRKERKPEDRRACLADFSVECHHPSHHTRCGFGAAVAWPRARLVSGHTDKGRWVSIRLEWKPHSGGNPLTITPEGRILAA